MVQEVVVSEEVEVVVVVVLVGIQVGVVRRGGMGGGSSVGGDHTKWQEVGYGRHHPPGR